MPPPPSPPAPPPRLPRIPLPALVATRGLPGSGKTTWALEYLANEHTGLVARCNRDELRRMLYGTPRYDPFSEDIVTAVQNAVIGVLLARRHRVIVDDTNLNPRHMDALRSHAVKHGATFDVVDFTHIPLEVCIKQDNARSGNRRVGESVIRNMQEKWLPTSDENSGPA